ncbi:MAG: hypothetical protein GX621_06880 [Pirellulaceae bacterium]|nr:hypothetical protein [Pirellulaceae bacterium]
MLRGIGFPTILVLVFYTSLASLSLSMACLFLGTMTTEKYHQVVLSVFAVIGLFMAFWIACTAAAGALQFGQISLDDEDFWIGNAAMITLVGGYFVLVFEAAAARVTFAADNRSSRLRWVMLLQFALFVGWMTAAWIESSGDEDVLWPFLVIAELHWFVMGAMMIGESPDVSLRVRRGLPRSRLGRMFLTWFNPGPGTGYVFAVTGMVGALAIALAAVAAAALWPESAANFGLTGLANPLWFGFLGLCYGTFFLGLCLWLIRLIRRFSPVGIMTAVLLEGLLVMLFSGIPAIIHMMSPTYHGQDYSFMQIISPVWTLGHIIDKGLPPNETVALLTVVPVAALLMLLLNVPGLARELAYVRIAAPERVVEEDEELASRQSSPEPIRTSPWDDQPIATSE